MTVAVETTHTQFATPSPVGVILSRELRANRRTFLLWLVPLAGMIGLLVALHPSMAKDGGLLSAKMAMMPEAMRQAFGLTLIDFTRPASYMATYFIYVTLCGSLMPGLMGASVIAREEVSHTAEVLLTQPVSRTQVIVGKACGVLIFTVSFHTILAVLSITGLHMVATNPVETWIIASMYIGSLTLGVFFAGLGMLVAVLVKEARSASGSAMGLIFGSFIVGVLSSVTRKASELRWFSPFKWLEASDVVRYNGLAWSHVVVLLVLGITAGIVAGVRYNTRDIHA